MGYVAEKKKKKEKKRKEKATFIQGSCAIHMIK